MQCLRPSPGAIYSGINDAFKKMVRTEGALSPFRGMNIVALGAGPAHALYFSSYESTKKLIGSLGHGNHSSTVSVGKNSFKVSKRMIDHCVACMILS